MTTAILVAQIIAVILQACFLLLSILLLAAAIKNTDEARQREAHAAMDEALALVEESHGSDPWQGRWPPWDDNERENTGN